MCRLHRVSDTRGVIVQPCLSTHTDGRIARATEGPNGRTPWGVVGVPRHRPHRLVRRILDASITVQGVWITNLLPQSLLFNLWQDAYQPA
ncbi:hypothetical protein RESH_03067 [Rhodopirellula europaea SH398]|uniref:Uncharacterized protein n=1 Tax=Rhodopirellula europaea SH398 TaxID=1263868 RepID=M5S461_9BACT|nr:hypothetical protein RESH_03067 [Rhodopirellula europaea SH398]